MSELDPEVIAYRMHRNGVEGRQQRQAMIRSKVIFLFVGTMGRIWILVRTLTH